MVEAVVIMEDQQTEETLYTPARIKLLCNSKESFRNLLVDHFAIQFQKHRLEWPKRMNAKTKKLLPYVCNGDTNYMTSGKRIIQRAVGELQGVGGVDPVSYNNSLRKDISTFYRINRLNAWESVGFGLFTNVDIRKGQVVAYFFGSLKRPQYANKSYSIQMNENLYLDCSTQVQDGTCMASLANSPTRCYLEKSAIK